MSQSETPASSLLPLHRSWLDKLGLTLSTLCLIHCLAAPLIFALLPFLKQTALAPFHLGMALLVIPIGTIAFFRGYQVHHKPTILTLGLVGLGLISLGVVTPEVWEEGLTIAGSLLASLAHVLNLRARPCGTCSTHHTNIKSAAKG